MRASFYGRAALLALVLQQAAWADPDGAKILKAPDVPAVDELAPLEGDDDLSSPRKMTFVPPAPDYRNAVGISYAGGQLRHHFSERWSTELRYQHGSANSNEGHVGADVFGLREYRYFGRREAFSFYGGGEGAYAKATPDSSPYSVSGFALGGFGGVEYRVLRRLSISADIGPYVIALHEQQTGLSETGLDFVLNTAINFYLF